jgi:hypothetical protein
VPLVEEDDVEVALDADRLGRSLRDARHLVARLLDGGRAVDAEHAALRILEREAGDHPGLRRAGHGADDDRVEEDAELGFLVGDLLRPACKAEAAERVVGRACRNRIGPAAGRIDRVERILPARAQGDVEAGVDDADVGAHDPREEDVPDLVVDDVGPFDPVLLHEHALQPEPRSDRRDLARVVRLHAADRHERVAALCERLRGEVFELAHLVAAVREAGVAILALRPDLDAAAEMLAQPLERMDRRRSEQQVDAREVGEH